MPNKELDHGALDTLFFETLCGDTRQISWGKNQLKSTIGKKLYNECLRIGLLTEEDGYDFYAMEYKTETTCYHKLFVEWFAAHYLAKEVARQEAEFEPWPDKWPVYQNQAASTSQQKASVSDNVRVLKSLDPKDVHYMYRFACGLNCEVALKIIDHLAKKGTYDEYAQLCITEWGGGLEEIISTINLICSRGFSIDGNNSVLMQKSHVKLIQFASDQKIPVDWVQLMVSLDVDCHGNLHVKPSHLPLPVMVTLNGLLIIEYGREITREETDSALQYSAKCPRLKELWFYSCLLPRFIEVSESTSVLRSRDVTVGWCPGKEGSGVYRLNLEYGRWEDYNKEGTQITDEDYQKAVEVIPEWAKWRRRRDRRGELSTSSDESEETENEMNDEDNEPESDTEVLFRSELLGQLKHIL